MRPRKTSPRSNALRCARHPLSPARRPGQDEDLRLQLARFVSDEYDCDYLPQERAALECGVLPDAEGLDQLLERGWRRFGPVVFRPACRACNECVPLRIPVEAFRLTRSQRRAHNRCAHLQVEMAPPRVDRERLALFGRWHAGREEARGWQSAPLDPFEYARNFGVGQPATREVLYRDAGKLIGVGICDETPTAYSAVYFYHDPAYARLSLGVNHIVTLIQRARRENKAHVYLGYRVMGCPSMRYKARYLPHELLEGRPADEETPRWLLVGEPTR
jgi:leucyl-tRNA---protein transferase